MLSWRTCNTKVPVTQGMFQPSCDVVSVAPSRLQLVSEHVTKARFSHKKQQRPRCRCLACDATHLSHELHVWFGSFMSRSHQAHSQNVGCRDHHQGEIKSVPSSLSTILQASHVTCSISLVLCGTRSSQQEVACRASHTPSVTSCLCQESFALFAGRTGRS